MSVKKGYFEVRSTALSMFPLYLAATIHGSLCRDNGTADESRAKLSRLLGKNAH